MLSVALCRSDAIVDFGAATQCCFAAGCWPPSKPNALQAVLLVDRVLARGAMATIARDGNNRMRDSYLHCRLHCCRAIRYCCCCCMLVARCRLGSFLFLTSSLACLHRCPSAVVVVVAADVAAGWAWCNTRIEFAAVMVVGGLIVRRAVGVLLPDWRLEIVTMLDRRSGVAASPVKRVCGRQHEGCIE